MRTSAYALIALIAAAAGFGIYRYGVEPQLVSAPQAPSPFEPPSSSEPPEILPDFTLADLEGAPRSIRSWPGKSMIVNFWATWCAPCRREIPLLKEIQHEYGDEGFQLVGVAVDFREDVESYLAEIGVNYPVLVGEQDGLEAVSQFGQGSLGLPFTVFTDNQHRIVALHLGELHRTQTETLLEAVRRVNSGELTPLAARTEAASELAKLRTPDA